ncbi:MAG: LCP family protein, partial [Mycobacteriales bacterium]
MAVLGFVGISCGLYFANSLEKRVHRTDPFNAVTGGRPAKVVKGAMNILLVGSDSREPGEDPGVVGDRSDSLSIAHVDKQHHKVYITSIPRDTWVYIPRDKSGNGGRYAKINAASSWGGIPLALSTVERFTGVKIDHVLKIDFAGFKKVVD